MARAIALTGIALVAVGIGLPYLGFYRAELFFAVVAGFILAVSGAISSLRRAERRKCAAAGGLALVVAVASAALDIRAAEVYLIPLVAFPAAALGLVLLSLALFRGRPTLAEQSRRVRAESMRVNAEFSAIERDPQT